MPSPSRVITAAVAGGAVIAGLAGCTTADERVVGISDCPALISYDGHLYLGSRELKRDPRVTGRSFPAVVPRCGDSGGQGESPAGEPVRVAELAGVPSSTALLSDGTIYVRHGRELPRRVLGRWFRAPRCATPGVFTVTADWLGLKAPGMPPYDELRPPYRLTVHVLTGPRRYVGATISVHATADTDPSLSAADVNESLGHGGRVSASVSCAEGGFEAAGLRAVAPS